MSMLDEKVKTSNSQAYGAIIDHQKLLPYEPLNIESVCEAVEGVRLSTSPSIGDEISGCIIKVADDDFRIIVNGAESKTRQRFTAAHELAHFLLHKDEIGDEYPESVLLRGRGLSNKQEIEANKLAAEILMPYEAIDKYVENNNGSFTIRKMAKAFNVSPSTMAIRLGIPID